jgi:hypothetical protein
MLNTYTQRDASDESKVIKKNNSRVSSAVSANMAKEDLPKEVMFEQRPNK